MPKAEEALEKAYGDTYKDSIWRPALAAITRSETTEDALDELAKFKAVENGTINKGNGQIEAVETELMGAIVELKAGHHIFGLLPSFKDLVNPPGELEVGKNLDVFTSDADIVEAVWK